MKKFITLLSITSLLFSCGTDTVPSNPTITGNLSNLMEGSMIYLDYLTPNQLFTKDSAMVDAEGNYGFTYKIESLGYYRLRINEKNFINLVLSPTDQPVINADGSNLMDTYTIKGSPETLKFQEFQDAYKLNNWKQDSLGMVYEANPSDASLFMRLQQAKFMYINNMNQAFIKIIEENPASFVSLAVVQQLDPKAHDEMYKKVDEAIYKVYPTDPWVTSFHDIVSKMVNLFVGDEAPDFTINDLNGNPVSLSSLRGKVVLVDFWASWCRPCRAENPNVVKAYNKFSSKGFDVLSVSLDGMPQQQNAKLAWENAIKQDGLIWKNHVSELKGWSSSVVQLYGIEGIPYTLLLDKDGIIIGKNLRGGELEKKLEEVL